LILIYKRERGITLSQQQKEKKNTEGNTPYNRVYLPKTVHDGKMEQEGSSQAPSKFLDDKRQGWRNGGVEGARKGR